MQFRILKLITPATWFGIKYEIDANILRKLMILIWETTTALFSNFKAFLCCSQIIILTLSIDWKHGSIFWAMIFYSKGMQKSWRNLLFICLPVLRLSLVYVYFLSIFPFLNNWKKLNAKKEQKREIRYPFYSGWNMP